MRNSFKNDQPQVLKALARVLSAEGFQTAQFTSPQAFLEGALAVPPGCLVLDLAMQDIDGMAAADAASAPVCCR